MPFLNGNFQKTEGIPSIPLAFNGDDPRRPLSRTYIIHLTQNQIFPVLIHQNENIRKSSSSHQEKRMKILHIRNQHKYIASQKTLKDVLHKANPSVVMLEWVS